MERVGVCFLLLLKKARSWACHGRVVAWVMVMVMARVEGGLVSFLSSHGSLQATTTTGERAGKQKERGAKIGGAWWFGFWMGVRGKQHSGWDREKLSAPVAIRGGCFCDGAVQIGSQ